MKKASRKKKRSIVALRKRCKAKGTGLSHYIMSAK